MFSIYFKFIKFVLIMGIVRGTQSKECYHCEGINCLRASKVQNKASCADPMDNCVTVFEKFTILARGCYSSLPEEYRIKCNGMYDSHCHKCSKNLCNDKGTISCLQCNSEDNADCSSATSKIEPSLCSVSTSTNSYCFTRTSSRILERGCLTDTNEQLKCLRDSSCDMCIADGVDTCNRKSADGMHSGSRRATVCRALLLAVWLTLSLPKISYFCS